MSDHDWAGGLEHEPHHRWSVLVTWSDGEQEYLMQGARIAAFSARSRADEMRDFMLEGIADEVQGIVVVRLPAEEVEA